MKRKADIKARQLLERFNADVEVVERLVATEVIRVLAASQSKALGRDVVSGSYRQQLERRILRLERVMSRFLGVDAQIDHRSSEPADQPAGRSGGTRAPRLPIEDVEAAARALAGEWTLMDLAKAIDRTPGTTRPRLKTLIEAGVVQEVGDDLSHDGPGSAPKLYKAA